MNGEWCVFRTIEPGIEVVVARIQNRYDDKAAFDAATKKASELGSASELTVDKYPPQAAVSVVGYEEAPVTKLRSGPDNFREWLMLQEEESGPVGDIARDVAQDLGEKAVDDQHLLKSWANHLESLRACQEAHEALVEAWSLYKGLEPDEVVVKVSDLREIREMVERARDGFGNENDDEVVDAMFRAEQFCDYMLNGQDPGVKVDEWEEELRKSKEVR